MKSTEIVSTLRNHKGQQIRVCWARACKTRANVTAIVTKNTVADVRAGIDYANLASVKTAIADGERGEVEPLPWGEWTEFPFIIKHTPKGQTLPVDYVRLYPSALLNAKVTAVYFINGKIASREEIAPLVLASELRESDEKPTCFTVKAENVLAINA